MFMVNQLVGFGVVPEAGGVRTLTYQTTSRSASDLTTYTFSTLAIGTAAADRRVIVGVHGVNGSNPDISSVTIGGVTADIVIQTGAVDETIGIVIALVPTGTTADVVVTFASGMIRAGVSVWSCTGLSSNTAVDSDTSTADPASVTIDTSAGGFALAVIGQNAGSTYGWTNLTERYDAAGGDGETMSAADSNGETAGGSLAISCTYSVSSTSRSMAAASW